ncbi:MAG: acyl-CoA desaturase, partial [Nocardioidaceae bacterium]|nr:acyl-CoA desaturase [Nocardioidaceae bacterium]
MPGTYPQITPAQTTQARSASLYTGLAKEIRESGLLRRRYAWYWSRIALTVLAFAAIWVGIVLVGESWFQLLLAAALGVVITQFGFLGHDAAHRQMFLSAGWNDWMSRILSAVFAGLCFGWWKGKHNLHHANPNMEGYDPDIAPG